MRHSYTVRWLASCIILSAVSVRKSQILQKYGFLIYEYSRVPLIIHIFNWFELNLLLDDNLIV